MDYNSLRVLVVEDEPSTRFMIVAILRKFGVVHIAEASDGTSAVDAYASIWPHVVICDIDMKPMNGIDYFKFLLTERDCLGRIAPVIFLTSHSEAAHVEKLRRMGAAGYLLKPASAAMLRKYIDAVLANHGDVYVNTPLARNARTAPVANPPGDGRCGVSQAAS